MSLATNALNLLVARITSLTGITGENIVRVTAATVLTIEKMFKDTELTVPFVILLIGNDQLDTYSGMGCQTSVMPVDIGYFVARTSHDQIDVLETACELLKTGLWGYQITNGTGTMQILDQPVKNVDLSNQFNEVCLHLDNNLIAGSVRCNVIYGKIV